MATATRDHIARKDVGGGNVSIRRAVAYVRVLTDMQAAKGLSPEAPQLAIQQHYPLPQDERILNHKDVLSGEKVAWTSAGRHPLGACADGAERPAAPLPG